MTLSFDTWWAVIKLPRFLTFLLWPLQITPLGWLFTLVALSYGVIFALRLKNRQRYSGAIRWVPPTLHLLVWSYMIATFATAPPLLSVGWGALALVLVLCPLLFDPAEQLPEWLDISLLFAGLATLLWIFLAISTTPTSPSAIVGSLPKNALWMQTGLLLTTYVGIGLMLTGSMLAWQMQHNSKTRQPQANLWFQRMQRLASLAFLTSLLVLLFGTWQDSMFSWGNLVLGLLALTSTMLPTLQPNTHSNATPNSFTFSSVHGLLTKASGLLAVTWLLFHLILTA